MSIQVPAVNKRSRKDQEEDELKEEDELGAFRSFTVIICGNGKLTGKFRNDIFIEVDRQFHFNSHPFMGIGQRIDAFTEHGVYHSSYFVLSTPDRIKINHSSTLSIINLSYKLEFTYQVSL